MKKYLAILVALIMLVSFTSCRSLTDEESVAQGTEPSTVEAVDRTRISMQLQEYRDHIIAEIPVFESDVNNVAIDALNAEIDEKLMSLYLEEQQKDAQSLEEDEDAYDHTWVNIRSYPITGKRYVQVICTAVVEGYSYYLDENTQGHVYSFVYDKDSKKQVTTEEALRLAGTTEEEIADKVKDSYSDFYWTENYEAECTVDGFRIIENENGSYEYEFYIYIYVYDTYEEESFSVIGILSADDSFSLYNGNQIIEPEYLDMLEPTLYYGM